MKIYTSLLIIISSFHLNAQTPLDYLNSVNAHSEKITNDTWDYIKLSCKSNNVRRIDRRRTELIATLKKSKYSVSHLKPFEGDARLRDATTNYLTLSIHVLNNDFAKIINLEEVAEQSYDAMETYLTAKEMVNIKMDSAYQILYHETDAFANTYEIKMVENESRISKKISNANQLNEYYNDIYLLFFKSCLQEKYYLQAVEGGRIGDIEQNRQSLENTSKADLEKIKSIAPYNGDGSLKKACSDLVYFYYSEAVKYGSDQLEFFLKKQSMDELHKKVTTTKQKDLSKEVIDEYNSSMQAYNAAVNQFNETNEYLNKNRTIFVEAWNKQCEKFFENHM